MVKLKALGRDKKNRYWGDEKGKKRQRIRKAGREEKRVERESREVRRKERERG